MRDLLLTIGDILLLGGAAGVIVFAFSYATFFNWRKTQAGRAFIGFVSMLIAIFIFNLISAATGGEYPGREWVRILVYGGAMVASWRLVWTLWRGWGRTAKTSSKPSGFTDTRKR